MKSIILAALLCFFSVYFTAHAQEADASFTAADKRIKTFVYNESEVFIVTTRYGYQTNIEFGKNETIDTISVGQQFAWQIVPSGRRLFIRAQEDNVRTNMTVITSKRAYQFDLRSTSGKDNGEIVYVARFYYPDEEGPKAPNPLLPAGGAAPAPLVSGPVTTAAPVSPVSSGSLQSSDLMSAIPTAPNYNFQYSFTGKTGSATPLKIFDDGKSTYFQFRNMQAVPSISVVSPRGQEVPLTYQVVNGYAMVDIVAGRFTLRDGNSTICVYNEGYVKP